jgi:hypothetical protein
MHRGNDLCLSANDPATGFGGRKIAKRQRPSLRTNDVAFSAVLSQFRLRGFVDNRQSIGAIIVPGWVLLRNKMLNGLLINCQNIVLVSVEMGRTRCDYRQKAQRCLARSYAKVLQPYSAIPAMVQEAV